MQQVSTRTPEELACLAETMSRARFGTYLSHAGNDHEKALSLYLWNIRLSESLLLPLQAFEVSLRNSVNRCLTDLYGPDWWQPASLAGRVQKQQIERVQKVIEKYSPASGQPVTQDFVVANLSLAFWVDLFFYREYEKLWQFGLHKTFSMRPKGKGIQRSTIAPMLKSIHTLRNRVAHHEPIAWSRNPTLDMQHANLLQLTEWICPVTATFVRTESRFPDTWKATVT